MTIKKITALVSADGWWAGYDNDGKASFNRLAVFASVLHEPELGHGDSNGDWGVVGMDALDLSHLGHAAEANNFRGFYHDSDFDVLGVKLNKAAEDRFSAGGF